uniref:RING-type domain-containing protein n=1 Tax=Haptolina ericina TaxID=156174 RepID=A0A7S3AHD1_9EUKA
MRDCSSVLDNTLFKSEDVTDSVRKKLEKRQSEAMALLSSTELHGEESNTAAAEWLPSHLTQPNQGRRRRGHRGLGGTRRNHAARTAENANEVDTAEDESAADGGANAAAVVRTTELASTEAFFSDACSVCFETWEGELRDSFAMVLPCAHTLCAKCLVGWHATCTAPRAPSREGTRLPPRQEFACVECRSSIPRRAVQVLLTGVETSVDSFQLLAPRLGCDKAMQSQIVHSLLLHHDFDISAVEGSLWEMLQAREVSGQAHEPLQSEQKQAIYDEARRPVRRLEAELADARVRLKALRVDENGSDWCSERETVDDLTCRLKAARLNAAEEIFAQMNAEGLGMGEDTESLGECTLDFHGLHAKEAERLATELIDCVLPAMRSLVIITGRGSHSAGGHSILRPVIERLVADRSSAVRLEAVDGNRGAVRLRAHRDDS